MNCYFCHQPLEDKDYCFQHPFEIVHFYHPTVPELSMIVGNLADYTFLYRPQPGKLDLYTHEKYLVQDYPLPNASLQEIERIIKLKAFI